MVEVRQFRVRKIVIVRGVCENQVDARLANPAQSFRRLVQHNSIARYLVPLCRNRAAHCWPNPIACEYLFWSVTGSGVPILKRKAAVALAPQDFLKTLDEGAPTHVSPPNI